MTPSLTILCDKNDFRGLWKNLVHKEYFGRCWSVKPKLPQVMLLWIVSMVIVGQLSLVNGEKENKIIGLVGESAVLPCDVDESSCGNVYFITWTKNVSNTWKRLYLYSEEVKKPLQELANPARAHFSLQNTTGYLTIRYLRLEDDGMYKCDVTYVAGKCPSLSYAPLFIHAQPSAPVIEKDGKVSPNGSIVGPFTEGASLSLKCKTMGGKPTPQVTWHKGDEDLDSESHVTVEKNGASSVTSSVRVTFERDDLGKKIECQVDNEATEPLVTWVEIDLKIAPINLDISGPTEPVIAGDEVTLTCTIDGAKPAANASWFNKSDTLQAKPETRIEIMPDGTYRTISEVEVLVSRHDHLGEFICVGMNAVSRSMDSRLVKSLVIEVYYPPVVKMDPSEMIVANISTNANVVCTYDANPKNVTDVHWYHEDKELDVSMEDKYHSSYQGYPTLTIKNIKQQDAGMYSCSLRNDVGLGNATNDVRLNVLYPPTVKAIIAPENAIEGDSIALICDVIDGNPRKPLRVRWHKYDETLHEIMHGHIGWHVISRNLTGNYSCEAENSAGWGERSAEIELIVQYLPAAATIEEVDPPSVKGHNATLQCIVEEPGLPPANAYLWMKDGVLIKQTTEEYLTIETAFLNTTGNYSCSAINEVGAGAKGYWVLKINAPPVLIEELPPIQGAARDNPFIRLTCQVECDPLCEVHWLKEEASLQNSELYTIKSTVNLPNVTINRFISVSSTLQFNMTLWPGRMLEKDRDRANYTCSSTGNTVGKGVNSTTLFLVEYPPEFPSLSESEVDVEEGNIPEEVECSASSWPPSKFHWKKGGIVITEKETLTFEKVSRKNAGEYVCVAENDHGRAMIEMKLNVLYKPNCTISQSTEEDGDLVLVCTASGNPSLINFTWIKDNDTLHDDFGYEPYFEDTQSKLVISDLQDSYGLYACIAINEIGQSEPCERLVEGPVITGYGEVGDMSVLVIAAIIGGIAIIFVLIILIIVIMMRKRRLQNAASPAKQVPTTGGDNLYQNVSGTQADRKQNGPSASESEGNVMYENMPFHRQGPYRPDSTDEMVYADLYDDVKAGKVPDPRLKPPLPPKGIGKKPKEPPLPPKTKKGGSDFLGI